MGTQKDRPTYHSAKMDAKSMTFSLGIEIRVAFSRPRISFMGKILQHLVDT